MQGEFAKFSYKFGSVLSPTFREYVAKRLGPGDRWCIVYGRDLPDGNWTGDKCNLQTVSNFKDFTLMSSDEVEELFYEVL